MSTQGDRVEGAGNGHVVIASENGHSENGHSDNGSSPSGPNWNSWIHGDDPTSHPNSADAQMAGADDVSNVAEMSDQHVDVGRIPPVGRVRATWPKNRLNTPTTPTDFEPSRPVSSPGGNRSGSVVPVVSVPLSSGPIATAPGAAAADIGMPERFHRRAQRGPDLQQTNGQDPASLENTFAASATVEYGDLISAQTLAPTPQPSVSERPQPAPPLSVPAPTVPAPSAVPQEVVVTPAPAPSPPLSVTPSEAPIEPAVQWRTDGESEAVAYELAPLVSQSSFSPPAGPMLSSVSSAGIPVGSLDRREPLLGPRATINVREMLGYLLLVSTIAVAATAGAFLISGQRTPLYGARAEIRYPLDADQSTGFLREDRQLSTQLLLLTSRSMLAPIARESEISFEELEDKVSASVVSQSEIIHLEAKDEDPDVALGLVLRISESYLGQVTRDVSSERRDYLETEIGLISTRLDEIVIDKRTIVQGLDPTKVASDALLGALTAEELQLLQRSNTLESEIDSLVLDNLQVGRPALMSSPFVLEDPVAPNTMQDAVIGLAVGLLLATGAVFILRVWTLNRPTQG